MRNYGTSGEKVRGIAIDYAALPGAIPRLMLPFLGVSVISKTWLGNMKENSQFYSKSGTRSSAKSFSGDSKSKEDNADSKIKKAGIFLMKSSYDTLTKLSMKYAAEIGFTETRSATFIWSELSKFPSTNDP